MNTTASWKDKPYWVEADRMAYEAYHCLFPQVEKRGTYNYTQYVPFCLDYSKDIKDTEMCIEYVFRIESRQHTEKPDNLGFCTAADDFAEIEIITMLPKNYRMKKLKKNSSYHFDLLNVIRHEIEHVFQSGEFKLNCIELKEYERSKKNFLLDPAEVPAYVHGFRICTNSRQHFYDVTKRFIEEHGSLMELDRNEIKKTIKIWNDYLNNLKI